MAQYAYAAQVRCTRRRSRARLCALTMRAQNPRELPFATGDMTDAMLSDAVADEGRTGGRPVASGEALPLLRLPVATARDAGQCRLSSGAVVLLGFVFAAGTIATIAVLWHASILSWSKVGKGTGDWVYALAANNNVLYAGGVFTSAGGKSASLIARWNGSGWSALGMGIDGSYPVVYALAVYKDSLYVGGRFSKAGGWQTNNIARWDGKAWSALGTGTDSIVYALAVYNALYVGGSFSSAGGASASRIARWDGTWSKLGMGTDSTVYALAAYDNALYVGGGFWSAGGVYAYNIARWDGAAWSALETGVNGAVRALAVYNNALYVGGQFLGAGDLGARRTARWNGRRWSSLGAGADDTVQALAVYKRALFAGGKFRYAGGDYRSVRFIARWGRP